MNNIDTCFTCIDRVLIFIIHIIQLMEMQCLFKYWCTHILITQWHTLPLISVWSTPRYLESSSDTPPPHYLGSPSDTPLPPHYLGSSSDPVARSVILGYLTFFLSSSSCDHSNSFRRLASFGVESFSWMAAFSSLATCQQENGNALLYMNIADSWLNTRS